MPPSLKHFLTHLLELRKTLVGMLIAWLASSLLIIPFAPALLRLCERWTPATVQLVPLHPMDGMSVILLFVLYGGLLLALPVWMILLGRFVFPGLTATERKYATVLLGVSTVLFIIGLLGGYFFLLPTALGALDGISQWLGMSLSMWSVKQYITFMLKVLLASAIVMQLPIVLLLLVLGNIVTVAQLRHYRRHAVVTILIIAMFLTPPDPVTQIVMAVPLYLLYEGCILVAIVFFRKKS